MGLEVDAYGVASEDLSDGEFWAHVRVLVGDAWAKLESTHNTSSLGTPENFSERHRLNAAGWEVEANSKRGLVTALREAMTEERDRMIEALEIFATPQRWKTTVTAPGVHYEFDPYDLRHTPSAIAARALGR